MAAATNGNTQCLSNLGIEGGGQVVVEDGYAYIGHMKPPHGTSIIDISNPRKPRVRARLEVSPWSHSHKVRVCGDIMITNVEQDRRHFLRRETRRLIDSRKALTLSLGREPQADELARELGVSPDGLADLDAALQRGYDEGGFKVWDISDRANPRLLSYERTHGFGVHRFDMDERYAYISTEMPGYIGNILVIYDLANPQQPREVSRWWMPGQHLAGGETPGWQGYAHRLHHALRVGDELWEGRAHLSSLGGGTDPYRVAGGTTCRWSTHRGSCRRGARTPPRSAPCGTLVVRRYRPRRDHSAGDISRQRNGFALVSRTRTFWHAPVSGAYR
jgi:hypothetical protein